MKNINLDKESDLALYIQLYESIKGLIEKDLVKEDKLPSIRALAKSLQVNNVTVVSAYKLLEQEGYVYSVKGSGTYIKKLALPEEISTIENGDMDLMSSGILPIHPNAINFASVSPTPDLFPIEDFKKVLIEILDRDGGEAFLYPEVIGYEPLRESISKFLLDNYKTRVDKDQILITSGGQQGLDIVAKSLINPGDIIFIENPTYSGALTQFKSRGARIIGIPMKEDGIDIGVMEAYIKRYKPKFIYIMTNYQSPTTYSYSDKVKKELIRLANNYNFYIIEDDFLTDLSFGPMGSTLKSMDKNNKVIFIKSFSKIFMPGVRIGFLTLPRPLFTTIIRAKHTTDVTSSGYLQRAFDLYLRRGYWKSHIDNIRNIYKEKYTIMINNLKKFEKYGISYSEPKGGLSIWLKLPKEIDSLDLYREASKNGLALVPGKIFFIDDSLYSNYIRISFGSVDQEEIIEGLNILEEIIAKPSRDKSSNYLPFI